VNVWTTAFAAGFFLIAAACTSLWMREAFMCALAGVAGGGLIGIVGLLLTRWETGGQRFYYTPSRWMALIIVSVVAARLVYAWWRGLHRSTPPHLWLNLSGTAISLAIAAALIGYYLVYAIGVRWQLQKHQRRRFL
jgi:glucan phosphoethanolaminetransferase (alkaline phosphatase superfamily)